MQEFARGRTNGAATQELDDLLYQTGATVRDDSGRVAMTHAGMLFFTANPQRVLPHVYIRLMRFGVPLAERDRRPPPDAQRTFGGPVTKQIQDFRAFIAESAFFKTYQVRDPTGGFREEPELPPIAVDEAVVNAVAHRDYAVSLPIECEKYTDALVVRSPGPVLQQRYVPEHFSLDDTRLDHIPRNSAFDGLAAIHQRCERQSVRFGPTRGYYSDAGGDARAWFASALILRGSRHHRGSAAQRRNPARSGVLQGGIYRSCSQDDGTGQLVPTGLSFCRSYAGQPPTRGNAYPRWPAQSIGLVYRFRSDSVRSSPISVAPKLARLLRSARSSGCTPRAFSRFGPTPAGRTS